MVTQKEIAKAAEILAKVNGIPKMPEELFNVYVTKAVHTIVELVAIDKKGRVLLTWRDDKFYHGWHIPGGFIGLGETVTQAAQRIAKREFGGPVKRLKFGGLFNYQNLDPRSHSFSLVHTCATTALPKDGRYFSVAEIKKLPKRDVLYHVPMLLKTLKLWR